MKKINPLIKTSLIFALLLTFITGCKKEDIEANNSNAKLVLLKITNQDATSQGSNYKITFTGSLLTEAKVNITGFGFKVMDNKGVTLNVLPSLNKISGSGTFEVTEFFLSDQNPNILEAYVITSNGDTLLSNSGYTILDIVNQFTIQPLEFYLNTLKLQSGQLISQSINTNSYTFNIIAKNNTDTIVHISQYYPSKSLGAFSTIPPPPNGFAIPPRGSIQLPVFYTGTLDSSETIYFINPFGPFTIVLDVQNSSGSTFLPLNFANGNVVFVQQPTSNKRKVGVYNFLETPNNSETVTMIIKNDNATPIQLVEVKNASTLYFDFASAFASLPIQISPLGNNFTGTVNNMSLNGDYAATLMFITDNQDTMDIETHIIRKADIQVFDGPTVAGNEITTSDFTVNFSSNSTNQLTFHNNSGNAISVTLYRDPFHFTDATLNETFTITPFGSYTIDCTTNSNTALSVPMSYSFGTETINFDAEIQ
jgi:predicted lipoprotein